MSTMQTAEPRDQLASRPNGSWWLTTLIGLPVLNVALPLLLNSLERSGDAFIPGLALALVTDAGLLIALGQRQRLNPGWAIVGTIVAAFLTVAVAAGAFAYWASTCDGCLN